MLPASLSLSPSLDLSFEGFSPEAFAILERLRQKPHIEQYRKEKEGIRTYIKEPFKRYRDDLVVNGVIPNHLPFETERNVFSRLLKNDFGAGGCHHHLWMAFYRHGLRRLTDAQLSHSIRPDGFDVGLFVGGYAKKALRRVVAHAQQQPATLLKLINELLPEFRMAFRYGSGKQQVRKAIEEPMLMLPDDLGKADALWLRRTYERASVLAWGPELVAWTLGDVQQLWPLYRYVVEHGFSSQE